MLPVDISEKLWEKTLEWAKMPFRSWLLFYIRVLVQKVHQTIGSSLLQNIYQWFYTT